MRYFILIVFSFTLLFSCGTEGKPAPASNKTAVKGKKSNWSKTKKAKKAKANKARYWPYMKSNAGLSDAQIVRIQSINKKYAAQTNKLKKSKKWFGKANLSTKKSLAIKKNAELKNAIGASWSKWTVASKNWSAANKKKKPKKKRTKKKK